MEPEKFENKEYMKEEAAKRTDLFSSALLVAGACTMFEWGSPISEQRRGGGGWRRADGGILPITRMENVYRNIS